MGVAGQSHRHVVMGFTDDSTQPTFCYRSGRVHSTLTGNWHLETDTPTGSVWRPTGQPIRGSVCSREGVTASRGHRGGAFQRRGVQQFLPVQEFRKTHTSSMLGLMCWDRLPGGPPSGHKHLLGQSTWGGMRVCVPNQGPQMCVCHCIVFMQR